MKISATRAILVRVMGLLAAGVLAATVTCAACNRHAPTAPSPAVAVAGSTPHPTPSASAMVSTQVPALFAIFDPHGAKGFIDASGREIIAPEYDDVSVFAEGLAGVRVGDKWGFIDSRGNMQISPRWAAVSPFSEGMALVIERVEKRYVHDSNYQRMLAGYIGPSGQYLIAPTWRMSAHSFHHGRAVIQVDWLSEEHKSVPEGVFAGYINTKGAWAFPPRYQQAEDFSGNHALALQQRPGAEPVFVFVNSVGAQLRLPPGWVPRLGFTEGLGIVYHPTKQQFGAVDGDGKLVFSIAADALSAFADGLAVYRKDNRSGYLSTRGEIALPASYQAAGPFSEGLASVTDASGQAVTIDKTGRVVLPGSGEPFRGGLQYRRLVGRTIGERADLRNIYGYRNKQDQYVWLAPDAEQYLDAAFLRDRYIGPPRGPSSPSSAPPSGPPSGPSSAPASAR